MYEEFQIPSDDEIEAVLGVHVETAGEIGVRRLELSSADLHDVALVIDPLGRSVHLTVSRRSDQILSLTREGATVFSVSDKEPAILINFRTEDTTGSLGVSLTPALRVEETVLLG